MASPAELRAFARRDWTVGKRLAPPYATLARTDPAAMLEIADALRLHALDVTGGSSERERSADLRVHRRVSKALSLVRSR